VATVFGHGGAGELAELPEPPVLPPEPPPEEPPEDWVFEVVVPPPVGVVEGVEAVQAATGNDVSRASKNVSNMTRL